jgi:hypothetical protein
MLAVLELRLQELLLVAVVVAWLAHMVLVLMEQQLV